MRNKMDWWQELRKWSLKMNLVETSTTSPHLVHGNVKGKQRRAFNNFFIAIMWQLFKNGISWGKASFFILIFLHLGPKQTCIWEHYWNFVLNTLNDTEICHLHPETYSIWALHLQITKLPLTKELWVKCNFTFLSVISKGHKIWITGICKRKKKSNERSVIL